MVVRELFAKLGFNFDERSIRKFDNSMRTAKGALGRLAVAARKTAARIKASLGRAADFVKRKLKDAFNPRRLILGLTAAFAAVGAFMARYTKLGDELDKSSKAIGVTAAALFKLRFAMRKGGVTNDQLRVSFAALANQVRGFRAGSAEAENAFKQLGVTMKDVENLSTDELFLRVGDALGKIENPTIRAAIAQQLLGESGARVAAAFADGADAIRAEMKALEKWVSTDTLNKWAEDSKRLADKQEDLKVKTQGLALILREKLQPAYESVIDAASRFAEAVLTGTEVSGVFIAQAAAVGAAVVALAASYSTLLAVVLPLAAAAAALSSSLFAINQISKAASGESSIGGDLMDKFLRLMNEEGGFHFPGTFGSTDPMLTSLSSPVAQRYGVLADNRKTVNNFTINGNTPHEIAQEVKRTLDHDNRQTEAAFSMLPVPSPLR